MRISRITPLVAAALCCLALPLSAAQTVTPPSSGDHRMGSADARITLIEYSDLQCPFCARVQSTLDDVVEHYDGTVNVVYRHFPLSFHQYAYPAAQTAECIAKAKGETAFWGFIKKFFADQDKDPVEVASDLGYDVESCVDDDTYADRIDGDVETGTEAGITGTPGFIVYDNTTKKYSSIAGAYPAEEFIRVIDNLIAGKTDVPPEPPVIDVPTKPETAPIRPYNKRTEYLRGRPTARFVVVEFGNLSEAFTPKLHVELKKLLLKRTDTAWAMRTTDLAFLDRNGLVQAQAAMCAGAQKGRYGFWRMVDIILAKHKLDPNEKMDGTDLQSLAERLGYTAETFSDCMANKTIKSQIDADVEEGEQYQAAPVAVIVDTRTKKQYLIQGAVPMQTFYDKIEEILAQD